MRRVWQGVWCAGTLPVWGACVAPGACGAQQAVTAATVTGEVVDPAGARVPGAAVVATQEETGVATRAVADGAGRFRLLYLLPGRYVVRAEAASLTPVEQRLQLTVGSSFAVTLRLGSVASVASVAVRADAVVLEANRSQQSEVVSATEFAALPFQGRNYLDAALLTPGVSATNTNSVQQFAETASVVGQGYSVNSQRNLSNSVLVDGLSANDDASGLPGNLFSMDAVREVQVVTSGAQAEFGRALGGVMNVLTESGADRVHGTVFGLLRNQRLNAANALSQTVLPMTQTEAGASLGGPLQRERMFGFANYELRRLNTVGVSTIRPSDAAAIDARLNAVGFNGPRLAIASNAAGTVQYPTSLHTDTAFARLDRVLPREGRLAVRYSLYDLRGTNVRGAGGLNDVSYGTAVNDGNHTLAVSYAAAPNAQVFTETRAAVTHDDLSAPPTTENSPAVLISGVANFGRWSTSPVERVNTVGELVENVSLLRGAHTVKLGADLLVNATALTFPQQIRGYYTFASLAAFQAGVYNTGGFTQSFGSPFVSLNNPNLGVYMQDAWRVRPRLTLNLGARWDLQWLPTIQTDTNNVAPRVGVAWSPREGTVVRASCGLFYDRVLLRPLGNALLNANNTTDPAQGRLLSYTYSPGGAGAPVFPNIAAAPPAGGLVNYATMARGLSSPYSAQVSAGVEQTLPGLGGAVLGVSYQRVRGVHLQGLYNTNIRPDGTRPDPTRGNVKPYDTRFDSSFDGLEVSVRGAGKYVRGRVSYVWSKAIDNLGEFFFSAPLNNFDFGVDRGRSDDDQRHRLSADAAVHTGEARGGWRGQLLGGWELGGVVQYSSRLPFTLLTGAMTLQQTAARPCVAAFYGTTACAYALRGAVLPRNTGVGFDSVRLDARLSRTVPLGDGRSLSFAAQSFNATNHRNDAIPNTTFGTGRIDRASTNASFAAATAVGDARNVELGVRYRF